MSQWNERATRRNFVGLVWIILAALVLSACTIGDDDEDPEATETSSSPDVITPAGDEAGAATPLIGGATPAAPGATAASSTPGVVVSAPPVDVPGGTPASADPVIASPSSSQVETDADAQVDPASGISGDGTGGAGADAVPEGATEPPGEADAPPQTTPDVSVASSCDVTSYPPFTGESAEQVTTAEVNFRTGPGSDCEVIGEPIAAGITVQVLSDPVQREGDDLFAWVAVSVDGVEGWLATEFLLAA